MAKFNVVDMNGQHVSEIELSDAVFGITPNEKAVHIAVVNFLANQRQGTQNTKIRMEVSGGGKKPWRQKGTGHARQGSIRAPQWTHGGVALGPKPRSYNYHINNKVKRLALLSVLSDKAANGNMVVVDKFACDEYKTKAVVAMLNAVGAGKKNLLVNETVDAKFPIAIMIEPVQGEGGVHPATPEFMKGLREFCDEKGMLLLIDEVQTGWCRTGAVMSYMNYGIKPDIVSMAKGLGGGMPIGAICATEEVSKAFSAGSHGTTFGGHPVCCAAALAEVNELLDRDLAGNAKKVGDYFTAKLEKLPHVKEVRHQGLLVGVEFDDTISGVDVKHGCFDRHMLITAIGSHIIRMVPPLIVSEEECDKAFDIIKETVESLS